MKNNCIYFAEGKCEERLLNALKENPQKIQSGRVKVFNVIQELIPKSQLVTIQAGTTVVLVFDTDVPNTECLRENIKRLSTLCTKLKLESCFCNLCISLIELFLSSPFCPILLFGDFIQSRVQQIDLV